MEKKSSKIIKKKRSKKSKQGQKKRTAPAALVKVMNVSNDLADIIGMKKASRRSFFACSYSCVANKGAPAY